MIEFNNEARFDDDEIEFMKEGVLRYMLGNDQHLDQSLRQAFGGEYDPTVETAAWDLVSYIEDAVEGISKTTYYIET